MALLGERPAASADASVDASLRAPVDASIRAGAAPADSGQGRGSSGSSARAAQAGRPGPSGPTGPSAPTSKLPGLALAALGVAAAGAVHLLLPPVPMLTAAVVLGILAAHLPGARTLVRGLARPGLSLAGKRLMRLGVVLLGLKLSVGDVIGLGWATVAMVVVVVAATFTGTQWLGRRLGLPGDQPLLIATGYSICGASAICAVSEVRDSEERDVATSVALVTLCGTLAIAVLPLLHHPLGLDDGQFGRWIGAGVHDVGQVVAAAQTAGPHALGQAVLVKLMRVALLAPLVAAVVLSVRARAKADARTARTRTGTAADAARPDNDIKAQRPPLIPLFVLGFLLMVAARTTGWLPGSALGLAGTLQEVLLAAALFGLGSAVHLPTLARTGWRVAALGLCSWVVIAGVSYGGVLLTA
ncbi:MAG TPA: putative sulfate exporter family transporter [Streptomyces sp.]|nr:putative sulfate exporter family transporter [Streptomyces sp.]